MIYFLCELLHPLPHPHPTTSLMVYSLFVICLPGNGVLVLFHEELMIKVNISEISWGLDLLPIEKREFCHHWGMHCSKPVLEFWKLELPLFWRKNMCQYTKSFCQLASILITICELVYSTSWHFSTSWQASNHQQHSLLLYQNIALPADKCHQLATVTILICQLMKHTIWQGNIYQT